MKRPDRTSPALMITGIAVLSLSAILERYITLSDTMDGFIKGIAIGVLILSIISRKRKQQVQV